MLLGQLLVLALVIFALVYLVGAALGAAERLS